MVSWKIRILSFCLFVKKFCWIIVVQNSVAVSNQTECQIKRNKSYFSLLICCLCVSHFQRSWVLYVAHQYSSHFYQKNKQTLNHKTLSVYQYQNGQKYIEKYHLMILWGLKYFTSFTILYIVCEVVTILFT